MRGNNKGNVSPKERPRIIQTGVDAVIGAAVAVAIGIAVAVVITVRAGITVVIQVTIGINERRLFIVPIYIVLV